jgi:hypothetical protein
MIKSALLLSTTIGLSVALATGGIAATKHASTTVAHAGKLPARMLSQGKIKGSAVGSGLYGSTSTTSVTNLDNESVNCKSKSGSCVLAMSAMVQQCSFDGEFAANLYAIQTLVDGNYVDFGPYAGGTSTSHVCDIQNWQGTYIVASGSHTVTFDAYESSAAWIGQWSDRTDVVSQ